ncbi:MAG: DUF1080 domain-containing protein, partial [Verrucomicrobiota bacterium]
MKNLPVAIFLAAAIPAIAQDAPKPVPTGYTDTPVLPNSQWKVHDDERPRPTVVTPGKTDNAPPADATVLFDGTNLDAWLTIPHRKKGEPEPEPTEAQWKVENGYVEVTNTGDIRTKESFGSCQLHIEWMSPDPPQMNSQKQGNSGIFLMGLYEVQVLDGYDNLTYADGMPGAIYGQYPPAVNVSRKPGEWQSYDIIFTAPEFNKAGKLGSPAYITILHNGVLVQNHTELLGPTLHKRVANYDTPHATRAPLELQDHRDKQAVRFRN